MEITDIETANIKFHIKARTETLLEDIFRNIQAIKKVHPNAEIIVEVEM